MLKKLMAISLACIMVLSTLTVVSFANTAEEPNVIQEWTEDFNSYTSSNFNKANIKLYYLNDACGTTHHAGIGYHYELNDDWIMWNNGSSYLNTDYFSNYPKVSIGYNGKAKDDVSIYTTGRLWPGYKVSNFLGGTPVDLSTGKAINFSMDWFNNGTQSESASHVNTIPKIMVNATLSKADADDVTCDLKLAEIDANRVKSPLGNSVTCDAESWNALDLYISKDTINLKASEDASLLTFYTKNYTPSSSAWNSSSNSGYEIKSINSITILSPDNSSNPPKVQSGYDNLKISVLDAMPQTIVGRNLPFYANFKAVTTARAANITGSDVNNGKFNLVYGVANNMLTFGLSQNHITSITEGPYRISAEVICPDGTAKSASTKNEDGYYKVYNVEQDAYTGEGYFEPLSYLKIDPNATTRLADSDKVQVSYEFKFDGNNSGNNGVFVEAYGATSCNKGKIFTMTHNGRIYDASNKLVANLKPGTTYSIDTIYTVHTEGTEAEMYVDGSKILTATLRTALGSGANDSAYRLTYYVTGNTNADGTKYLANAIYLDNVCYQVFKGGINAFDFNKNASTATNAAIANADIDFINGTIFPVAADFTVADFNALGLTNATVLEADKTTAVADTTAALVGKVIKFTGDYGKDVYYTVSSEGGSNVTKTSFVTIRENLGSSLVDTTKAGNLLTAKAVKDGESLDVYIAEYNNDELVGLEVSDGIANYNPKAAGNKIKVFVWSDGGLVPVFAAINEIQVQ